MKYLIIKFVMLLLVLPPSYGQSKSFTRELKRIEENQRAVFPSPLAIAYNPGTLGDKIQQLYEVQAKQECDIKRTDKRLYIPKEILNGYGDDKLRRTLIYDMPVSADNLLFLALSNSDIIKIQNGTFNENEFIKTKRIIGINDHLVNFGFSTLTPIDGFPNLVYQNSCGSYFVGESNTKISAPVAEIEASLRAETSKKVSITTVSGNFISPLFLILKQDDAQSVYTHLLLWEIYADQYRNNQNTSENLHESGKYISSVTATLNYRAINLDKNLEMNGRLAANASYGLLKMDGSVRAGHQQKTTFDLKDFITSIHMRSNRELGWELSALPQISEINSKLHNSQFLKLQNPIESAVTHLLPTVLTRVLVGVPSGLCAPDSWMVNASGYDTSIWREKPVIISTFVKENENDFPECMCKITGYIKRTAITTASKSDGLINIELELNNKNEIAGQKLKLIITETAVRVNDNPKISQINSDFVNANRVKNLPRNGGHVSFTYPINFIINSTGIGLMDPYKISNIEIEYLNKENEKLLFYISQQPVVSNGEVAINILSAQVSEKLISQKEILVPIKIKFNVEIRGGGTTQLATNTINLKLPELVEQLDLISNEQN